MSLPATAPPSAGAMESKDRVKVYAGLALAGVFFVAEIVASHVTHSLVLLLYAYQMLYNVLALVLLVISYHVRELVFLLEEKAFYLQKKQCLVTPP